MLCETKNVVCCRHSVIFAVQQFPEYFFFLNERMRGDISISLPLKTPHSCHARVRSVGKFGSKSTI